MLPARLPYPEMIWRREKKYRAGTTLLVGVTGWMARVGPEIMQTLCRALLPATLFAAHFNQTPNLRQFVWIMREVGRDCVRQVCVRTQHSTSSREPDASSGLRASAPPQSAWPCRWNSAVSGDGGSNWPRPSLPRLKRKSPTANGG